MTGNGASDADKAMRLARGLGWFSLGLGLTGFLMPGSVANLAGIPKRRGLIRLLGLREIASGAAIFLQRRPANALWSRVAGDVMDLGLLTVALASPKSDRGRVLATIGVASGVTALDVRASRQVSANVQARHGTAKVETSLTIDRPAEELYTFWRRFENLPQFMEHLKSVQQTGDDRWHWVAKGPAGIDAEWDAEIINERPNEIIAWRSLVGSSVDTSGTVRFERAPGGRGTVVRVKLEYSPPAGALGAVVARIFGQAPEKQVPSDLRRFKQLMETGEILRTEGQPAGRSRSTSWKFDDLIRK